MLEKGIWVYRVSQKKPSHVWRFRRENSKHGMVFIGTPCMYFHRVFNEKTKLLEYTLFGLISGGVGNVDIYTYIADSEVIFFYLFKNFT